jgi:hypothetical protein
MPTALSVSSVEAAVERVPVTLVEACSVSSVAP